jgi:hypothetical protein
MSIRIPEGEINEILEGVIDEIDEPMAQEICNVKQPSKTSGTDAYETLKSELPDDGRGMDVAPGAEVQEGESEYVDYNWNALKQVGHRPVTVEDENELEEFDRDAVEEEIDKATTQSLFNVERKFALKAVDGSSNGTVSAKGSWDDKGASSEPYITLGDAIEGGTIVKGTDLVIAPDVVEALRYHPATKEQLANINATGKVGRDVVLNALEQAHGDIGDVYEFDVPYDASAAALPLQYDELFSGQIWLGNATDFQMYWPSVQNNPYIMQSADAAVSGVKITVGHFVDFKRTRDKLGCYFKENGTAGVLS